MNFKYALVVSVVISSILSGCSAPVPEENKAPAEEKKIGTRLEYRVDLSKAPAGQNDDIIAEMQEVLLGRLKTLGFRNPNFSAIDVDGEKHIVVELPDVEYITDAWPVVGETTQLDFKEIREVMDPNFGAKVKALAEKALTQAKSVPDFGAFGRDEEKSIFTGVTYSESKDWEEKNKLPVAIVDAVAQMGPGQINDSLIATKDEYVVEYGGGVSVKSGLNIVKLLDKRTVDQVLEDPRQIKTAHILIAYKGASRADERVARNAYEAKVLAEEVMAKLKEGGEQNSFENLAKEYSDDLSNNVSGGLIDDYISAQSDYAQEYKSAALALNEPGEVSAITQSPFGFHIIKAIDLKKAVGTPVKVEQYRLARIFYSEIEDPWVATGLNSQFIQEAKLQFDRGSWPQVFIILDEEGAKMFEEITARNVGNPLAIFMGGTLISAPNVNEKISGGEAVISGRFTIKEAKLLVQDINFSVLTAGPVSLVGVGAME